MRERGNGDRGKVADRTGAVAAKTGSVANTRSEGGKKDDLSGGSWSAVEQDQRKESTEN
ncbi:hypothetical protein WN48_06714 [Eufriesea mexicana]|uniref:Uncharacterized protein n=1 Tax=Eufriesea mexicana TaxID=516756 RepID=A0A310SJA0_9HYME|nr:hypothetical protein WN48_06714 [Eufriesea mexicana]